LAIGDGALGFWAALREVFGRTCEQRCWVHKTGNVLNAVPKSVQPKVKVHLHDIWQAETRADTEAAFNFFVETYGVKYDKTVAKLVKDREVLLAFYDFPAEHWKHIRTSNPIESTFATVRHRTGRTKGCLSRKTGLAMAVQADDVGAGKMAKTRRCKPLARGRPGDCLLGRHRPSQRPWDKLIRRKCRPAPRAIRATKPCGSAEGHPPPEANPVAGTGEANEEPIHEPVAEQREPCNRRGPRPGDGRDAPPAERRRQGGDARREPGRRSKAEEEVCEREGKVTVAKPGLQEGMAISDSARMWLFACRRPS
jgi:hypothetical protein